MVFTNHETRLLLPPENGFLPRDNGFLPPDYDFLPNHNESKTRYSSEFVGIRRNYSDNPPSRCPRAVRTGKTACWVFKNHESRITRHETRLFLLFSLLSCKLWSGMGRLWRGMGGHRPPPPAPATRSVWFSRITAFSAFPVHRPSDISSGANQAPDNAFHESRLLRFSRCFPASCGAAWGGYGAAWAAAVPRTGNKAFQVFHESRDTKHGFHPLHESQLPYPRFPTISRHFPPFPGPPPPSAVLGRPHRARRQPPLPPPAGKHKNGSPREHDSNVNL